MNGNTVENCYKINLKINHQENGKIIAVNNKIDLPFDIKRLYYLYDVPFDASRGGHAHKELEQIIIALSGSFDLIIKDGEKEKTYQLNKPNVGIYLPSGLWRELNNFSSGTICLVLVSQEYSEDDYIRNYDKFLIYKK